MIDTSTLPAPLPSTYSTRLLDGFPYCCIGEFIKFSICSTKAGTLSSYAASIASNLESGDSTVVLLLNFGGILQKIECLIVEYAQIIIQNKKMYRCSTNMSHWECQKYVSVGFWSRTYKSTGIGECAGMPGNYSFFALKRY